MRRCGEHENLKIQIRGRLQCLKRLYLQVHEPELAAEPDAATEAIIEQGREVGMLARQLFPGGVEVDSDGGLDQAIRATRELVANPEVPAIFEGTFENGGVLVRVDILQRREGRPLASDRGQIDHRSQRSTILTTSESNAASFPGRGWTWRRSIWRTSTAIMCFRDGTIDPRQFFQDSGT